jgi:hypothetical protein
MGITTQQTTETISYSWWDYVKHAGKVGLGLLDPFGLVTPALFDPSDNRTVAQRGADNFKGVTKTVGEGVGSGVSSLFGEIVSTEVLIGGALIVTLILVLR